MHLVGGPLRMLANLDAKSAIIDVELCVLANLGAKGALFDVE